MKKYSLLFVCLFALTPLLFSQIEKGTVMVGGNAGFQFRASKHKGDDSKMNEFVFSLAPNAMYSVIKQLALGGQLSNSYYQRNISDPTNPSFRSISSFTIGPAVRTNIFIGGRTYLFVHGSPSIGIGTVRYYADRSKPYDASTVIAWRFGPGFSIFATKNMAVELGLYYDGMKEVLAIKQNKTVLLKGEPVFTHGLTVAVGLQFYVHKKSKTPSAN